MKDNSGYGTLYCFCSTFTIFISMETEENKQFLVYLVDVSCFPTEFL